MTTKNLIAGLQKLSTYYDSPDGYNAGAEHDVIYAYATDNRLLDIDIAVMISLGWHQEHDERDYDEDFSPKDYRQDEGWVFYT